MARAMKDSGIEWIGEIPKGWECKKLKFCSQFVQQKYDDMSDNSLPYIGLENVVSWNGRYIETDSQYDKEQSVLFQEGDILWGKLRPYLAKVYHAKRDGCCSGEFCVIRIERQHSDRYFWNLLISSEFVSTVDRSTYGTKMPRANADFIKNVVVPVPPINEQSRIADFLDAECARIDAVIEQTRASIEEYKKLKQSVITQAVTKGIRPGRKMKDSGVEWIGKIPATWKLERLKWILRERIEKNNPQQTDFILSLGAAFGVIPYTEKTGGGNKAKETLTDYKLAYPKDIVLNSMNIISGSVGISNYFGCVSPVYYVLFPRDIQFSPEYYCYLFQTIAFQRSLLGLGNGILVKESSTGSFNTVRMRIPMEKLGIQLLPVPSDDEQKSIVDYLDAACARINAVIRRKEELILELESYKKSLIFEYVTGKKAVVI